MKKILFGVLAIIIVIILYKKENFIIIPNDSIRIRVISNSNNLNDLLKKKEIKDNLEEYLYNLLNDADSINEARNLINKNLDQVENIIKSHNISNYSLNYGYNYFPRKTYKGVIYPSGKYESLEVKLGEGLGNNYWCVLFPPLCLLEENPKTDDISYQFYVKKLLKIDK